MKKNVTPGETPEQITVSMIDQDLKDGISKPEMAIKYSIKPWEVDEMFKHPFLKGRRPSRKKTLSFTFVDDLEPSDNGTMLPLNSGDIAVEQAAEVEEEFVDPNQVTLEDAINEATQDTKNALEQVKNTERLVNEILSPEKPKTTEEFVEDLKELNSTNEEILEEIELDEDDNSFEL